MNTFNYHEEQTIDGGKDVTKADLLNRAIARSIDFIIVIALYKIIPSIGFLAGMVYLLIADGLFQGRSGGKRLIGLKVIVSDSPGMTRVCGYKESIIRNLPFGAGFFLYVIFRAIPGLGWLISFLAVVAVLVFEGLVVLGNEEGMRMGDELAKTRVVEDRQGGLNV